MSKAFGLMLFIALLVSVGCGSSSSSTSTTGETIPAVTQTTTSAEQRAVDGKDLNALAADFKKGLRPGRAIGEIDIPRIGVTAMISERDVDASFQTHYGTEHLEETPLPGMNGNFALTGYRFVRDPYPPREGAFHKLDELENGDEILVQTIYGRLKFKYLVNNKFIAQPEDVTILESKNEEVITLITCEAADIECDPIGDTTRWLVIKASFASVEPL